jgi:hypothetical protein
MWVCVALEYQTKHVDKFCYRSYVVLVCPTIVFQPWNSKIVHGNNKGNTIATQECQQGIDLHDPTVTQNLIHV